MSEGNLEVKPSKLPKTTKEHKFWIRSGLLINSPYVTHMHQGVKRGSVSIDDGSHVSGEEGFDSWAKRESLIFPERLTEGQVANYRRRAIYLRTRLA